MKPAPFAYHRPGDLADALDRLTELNAHGEEVKVLAGGQSLIPMMNFRLARPSHLVDIGRLREHAGIRFDGSGLRIGALTTHHEVELARLPEGFDMLNRAMRWIGHLPIRTRGTVGGSLVHGDATAEWCLLALILDARIVAVSPTGRREILAEDMFHGFYETEAAPEEIVTEIILPAPAPHAALTEFASAGVTSPSSASPCASTSTRPACCAAPGSHLAGWIPLRYAAPARKRCSPGAYRQARCSRRAPRRPPRTSRRRTTCTAAANTGGG
jgi:CO/xanthine dehydrogenase FAD-binding subunit